MAFTDYEDLIILKAKHPQIIVRSGAFIPDLQKEDVKEVDVNLQENINLSIETYRTNKFYVEENLVSPVLRRVWQDNYATEMNMWSHHEIEFDDDLNGIPDYMFTQLDQQQYEILSYPIIMVAEAVEFSFVEGWAKCVAEMLACQKINNNPNVIIFGIVTTGKSWEFAKLEGNIITKNIAGADIFDLPKLITIVDYLLGEAKKQL